MYWFIFAAYAAVLVFLVGIALIKFFVHTMDKVYRKQRLEDGFFINGELIPHLKDAFGEAMEDAMDYGFDVIPEKLKEVRKEMEGE